MCSVMPLIEFVGKVFTCSISEAHGELNDRQCKRLHLSEENAASSMRRYNEDVIQALRRIFDCRLPRSSFRTD